MERISLFSIGLFGSIISLTSDNFLIFILVFLLQTIKCIDSIEGIPYYRIFSLYLGLCSTVERKGGILMIAGLTIGFIYLRRLVILFML